MSDSEEDNENFCYFGKPLDPHDEDSFPKKRPISVEEQIATDAQGRRRFHGAFTGGFSAGFFNTVGTPEGWTPNKFKSSRFNKATGALQKPEDFMDEEDIGEYGIAPQVVRATKDYNTNKKRKKQVFSDGPIPGEPVLHSILTSGNETVGYILLKNLGIKDKIKTVSDGKIYGCQMPQTYEISENIHQEQYKIPEIYTEFLAKPKDNSFGLGYVGLDKNRFSLFPTQSGSNFIVIDKNKKMSITGQAFGVGAFEDDDDDIYMKEDMNSYDFELSAEKKQKKPVTSNKNRVFDLFVCSITPLLNKKLYPPPQIPHSFTGKHKVKRSRFEPIAEEEKPTTSRITSLIRARYLGEETKKEHTESKSLQQTSFKEELVETASSPNNGQHGVPTSNQSASSAFDIASLYLNDKFVSSSKEEDVTNILKPVEKFETVYGTDQMREAVRMKMFGGLTRTTTDWVPCALLCKRFNVPEPFVNRTEKTRTRTKNIIFEYQKHVEEETNLKPGLIKEKEEINTPRANNAFEKPTIETTVEIDSPARTDTIEIKNEVIEDIPVDITEKIDIEKQQDLYKAVFLSSDSESDREEKDIQSEVGASNNTDARKEEIKSTVLSDQLLPKVKPMKEGILSGMSFHKFSIPQSKVEETTNISEGINPETNIVEPKVKSLDPGLYGPRIPERIPIQNEKNTIATVSSDSEDQWIEKDNKKDKKKHKKRKKHKKEKHKKHKHEKKKKHRN